MKVEIIKQNGYNFLWIDNYLWMWDIPIERKMQKKIADQAYGDVLVVGYGLGIVQRYLTDNPKVNSIVTVEKHKEVIEACRKEYGRYYGSINCKDFYDFISDVVPERRKKWDCIVGDIWEDIIPEQLPNYKKFKRTALKILKPSGKLLGWGKEYFEYLIEKENNVSR